MPLYMQSPNAKENQDNGPGVKTEPAAQIPKNYKELSNQRQARCRVLGIPISLMLQMKSLFSLAPQTENFANLVESIALLEQRYGNSDSYSEGLSRMLLVGTFHPEDWKTDRLLLSGNDLASGPEAVEGREAAVDPGVNSSDRDQILLNNTWLANATAAEIEALLLEWMSEALAARSSADLGASDQGEERWSTATSENNAARSGIPINLQNLASGSGGFVINGQNANDNSGWCVAGLGDVNGDGLGDVLIGAPKANPTVLRSDAGRSYVVFGKTGTASTVINLSSIANGIGGFVINGACSNDLSGTSVAAAGDVNGDGLADLFIGAPESDPTSGANAGRSYVVFGKATTTAVQLSAIAAGNGGFVINGQSGSQKTGFSVSSAGDLNGDGLAELLIGAPYSDPGTGVDAGQSYVIFGQSSHIGSNAPIAPIELSNLSSSNGFAITGVADMQLAGISVASAGDVNGDGHGDLIIGAVNPSTLPFAEGYAYVVYGSPNPTSVNLSSITNGIGGFRIKDRWNASIGTGLGFNVAAAGDVNGDGLADVLVGNPNTDRAYVVFGKSNNTTSIDLISPTNWGFAMTGFDDEAGKSVATAGDINGDGLADLLIGAPRAAGGYGCTYVVFGKTSTASVSLDPYFFPDGIPINSQIPFDQSQTGRSVSSAGDVNGDGLADLLIGAPFSDPAGGVDAGRSYVILGATNGAFTGNFYDNTGTIANDNIQGNSTSESFAGGLGNDILAGRGGADVLNGGAGNDRFFLDPFALTPSVPNASALMNPLGSHPQLARINGGAGIDSIVITAGGLHFNLNSVANQSAVNSNGSSRITSIEVFDIRGSGLTGNALTLAAKDIDDITGFNWLNSITAPSHNITSGSYTLDAHSERRQLFVRGDANDALYVQGGSWSNAGTIYQSGQQYNVFQFGSRELIVKDGMLTVGL